MHSLVPICTQAICRHQAPCIKVYYKAKLKAIHIVAKNEPSREKKSRKGDEGLLSAATQPSREIPLLRCTNASLRVGHFLTKALQTARSTWSRLDTQQRAYAVIAGAALLIATPQLGTLLLISLERLLVGALLVVEEVLATALLMGTRAVVLFGTLAFIAFGVYLFFYRKQSSS